jgi:hypothetical protein
MSIIQHVQRVLEDRGLSRAGPRSCGFYVEDGIRQSAMVRWGRGEPFRDVHRQGIFACEDALRRAGFHTAIVQFANPSGHYISVSAPLTHTPSRAGGG